MEYDRYYWVSSTEVAEDEREKCPMTAIIVPVVVMVLFSALYSGVYIWMRRESFGEGRRKSNARREQHH
jgi:hypothetical protein